MNGHQPTHDEENAMTTIPNPKSPAADAWCHHMVRLAWPTVALTAAIVALFATVVVAAATDVIPLWLGTILNTALAYAAFTPAHEASHCNIAGRHSGWFWLNEACGWISMSILFDNFAILRAAHLQHHANTNVPDKDPDYFMPGLSTPRILLRCLTIFGGYMSDYMDDTRRKPDTTKRRLLHGSWSAMLYGSAIALSVAGYWPEVLMLWVVPTFGAFIVLALAFDYLPHRPHQTTERFRNTRIILAPGLPTLMLGQNYHLIHHLWPSVPFYRYGARFR